MIERISRRGRGGGTTARKKPERTREGPISSVVREQLARRKRNGDWL